MIVKNSKVSTTSVLLPPCSTFSPTNRKNCETEAETKATCVTPPPFDKINEINEISVSQNTVGIEMSSESVELLDTPPDSESPAKASENEDSPPKEHIKTSQTIPSALPEMDSSNPSLFWNDVTSRVDNLISKPSSFQRPRAHHF